MGWVEWSSGLAWMMMAEPSASHSHWPGPSDEIRARVVNSSAFTLPSAPARRWAGRRRPARRRSQAVRGLGLAVVDVSAGRGEGRGAFTGRMDVDAVPTGRQTRSLDLHQQASRPLTQVDAADVGAGGVDQNGLSRRADGRAFDGPPGARFRSRRRRLSGARGRRGEGRRRGGWRACRVSFQRRAFTATSLCHRGPGMLEIVTADHVPIPAA